MTATSMQALPGDKLRILVAEDHEEVLQEIVSLLEVEFAVMATVNNRQAVLEWVTQCQPDVVVLDLEIPIVNAIETATELMKMPSPPAVVICSDQIDPAVVVSAQQAIGYVFKTRMAQDLVEAVKTAVRGETFISSRCRLASQLDALELFRP